MSTATTPGPGESSIRMIEVTMTRPTAPDWGGEETPAGTHLYSHAWDSTDDELRLAVVPYTGSVDTGWAVMLQAPGVDVVMRCEPEQVLEWAQNVAWAVRDSRAEAGHSTDVEDPGVGWGAGLIAAERRRQVGEEGWSPEHDARHREGDLARAAATYALPAQHRAMASGGVPYWWPWAARWWKPSPDDRVRELTKAGALVAAEIDRLVNGCHWDRAARERANLVRAEHVSGVDVGDRGPSTPLVSPGPRTTPDARDQRLTAADWVVTLWNDWPQQKREAVALLSVHLHHALVDLTTAVRADRSSTSAPGVDEALLQLVTRWRRRAADGQPEKHLARAMWVEAITECADELSKELEHSMAGRGPVQWELVDAPTARGALIPGVERALFGTTDGGLLSDDEDVPVGELRRLLRDVWAQDDDARWSADERRVSQRRHQLAEADVLVRAGWRPSGWPAAGPPSNLPATLASVDDVRRVCLAAGLTERRPAIRWDNDQVVVSRPYAGHTGQLDINAGDWCAQLELGTPSAVLLAAIQAARSAS